jgi:type IV pilus secretin PilQ/predicted competence protein
MRRVQSIATLALLLPLIVGFSVCCRGLAATLLDVSVEGGPGETRVILRSNVPLNSTDYVLRSPPRIVVDCVDTRSPLAGKVIAPVEQGGVKQISITQFRGTDLVRVVIETNEVIEYRMWQEGPERIVSWSRQEPTALVQWLASEHATSEGVFHAVVARPQRSIPTEQPPMSTPPRRQREVGQPPSARLPEDVTISMDLEDADIQTVLRALADYSGRNIVASSAVTGKVTVRLINVGWRQALDIILKTAGYAYREEENIIRVSTTDAIEKEKALDPLVQRVYRVEFADPEELSKTVKEMLTERRGHVEVDKRTGALVVTDTEQTHERIHELVRVLDSDTPQVEIVAKILEANADAARHLGVYWSATNLQMGSDEVNVAGAMVMDAPTAEAGVGLFSVGTVTDWGMLEGQIELLERQNKGSIISNPRIAAVNNRDAEIFAGKRIPISVRDQAGNLIARYIDAGITLRVTPQINSLEDITLELYAEVSEPDLSTTVWGLPLISTSKAQSKVLIHDGQTVVLGGLKKTTESRSERGIPFLHSIPILGNLFKSSGKVLEDREIIIFVTPHIIKRL